MSPAATAAVTESSGCKPSTSVVSATRTFSSTGILFFFFFAGFESRPYSSCAVGKLLFDLF